jgi:2-keto-4-pentenoate hydratase/2-oxohepta-3-ene-1,7-dioic acid hydratase in catechol pathway
VRTDVRLSQFHDGDRIRVGIVEGETITPLDFDGDMLELMVRPGALKPAAASLPASSVTLAPAISRPSKIIAIGLNYADHIEESKGKVPEFPVVFAKFPSSLAAHLEPIRWKTETTQKVDFEAELAVIIGRRTASCSQEDSMRAVFGYTCANDVSARDLQFGDKQWVRGKSLDTFCPLGPWIVTADEVPDPHSLPIRCLVNGKTMQESNTGRMIYRLPEIIAFLSCHFTLFPGDVILTGTPDGVGAFRSPPVYLQDGDEVIVEIEGIGRLINPCEAD